MLELPLALAVLLPPAAGAVLWYSRRRPDPVSLWRIAVLLHLLLALSAWSAVETGESDEEAVEAVVPEAALETHEERAEVFLVLVWCAAAIATAGLLSGPAGSLARHASGALTLIVAIVALGVGHSGGELVYRYGAARVHTSTLSEEGAIDLPSHRRDHDDDDD
jgi:hypothetical protein